MVARAAMGQAACEVHATTAAQRGSRRTRHAALPLLAALTGAADVTASAAVARVIGGVEALAVAFGVTGVARSVAAAITQRLAMRRSGAGVPAASAIGNVVPRVDTRLLAEQLVGLALRLTRSTGANLPSSACLTAATAMTRIAAEGDAFVVARNVARIALVHTFAGYAAAFTMSGVCTRIAASAAVFPIRGDVSAAVAAVLERRRAGDHARAASAGGAAVEQRRTRGRAISAMLNVAVRLYASCAAIGRTRCAATGANAAGAHLAVRTRPAATSTVLRSTVRIHAVAAATNERRLAFDTALPGVTRHGSASLRRAGLATATTVRHVFARVHAVAAASQRTLFTDERAVPVYAHGRCVGRRCTFHAAIATVCRVRRQRRALSGADGLAAPALH